MKRKQYRITSNAGHDVIKSTWNSSIRQIEKFAKELATAEDTTYTLTGSHGEKVGFDFVKGYRQWESAQGKIVMFDIVKLEDVC